MSKYIVSGGGTGGHIFPALSIANTIKEKDPNAEILFVGAEGKMEMEKVPNAGYEIIGLPVRGLKRSLSLSNFSVLYKLWISLRKAKHILKDFKPDIVIGVGGFASAPLLRQAQKLNIPTLLQEQNSYAGLTNKWLGKRAKKICVAYENMERFFPKESILLTGNPVRKAILEDISQKREEAFQFFQLNPNKKTVLVLGGSLGARSINQGVEAGLSKLIDADVQLLWQTGKFYYEDLKHYKEKYGDQGVRISDFIMRMDLAYSLADVIISRAGASTVSELSLIKKPVIFVPSPNVAEDHQTKNAMALIERDAAMMIKDHSTQTDLVPAVIDLLKDETRCQTFSRNIEQLGIPDSSDRIVNEIFKLIK